MEDNIFEILLKNYKNNRFSHAYIIETNNVNKCLEELKEFVVKMIKHDLKEGFDNKIISQIEDDIFSELIIINKENELIKKETIQELQTKFSTKPNISKKNIYIILKPEMMNASSSNTILKFLEEPEEDIIGFFLTLNYRSLLPTILSRCILYKNYYEFQNIFDLLNINNETYERYIKLIEEITNLIENNKISMLFIKKKEFISQINDKEDMNNILKIMIYIYFYALNNNKLEKKYEIENNLIKIIQEKNTLIKITNKIKIIEESISNNNYNLNLDLSWDKIFIEMGKKDE